MSDTAPERYRSIAPSGVGEVLQLTDAGKRAWCSHTGGGGGGGGGGDTSSAIAPLRMRRRRSDIGVRKLDVDGSTLTQSVLNPVEMCGCGRMDPIIMGTGRGGVVVVVRRRRVLRFGGGATTPVLVD